MKKKTSRLFGALILRRYHGCCYRFSCYTLVALLILVASGNALAADALDQTISLEIAPNTPLDQALVKWGAETGVQVMMNAVSVATEKTEGVNGTQSARHLLAALLHDSGLSYTVEGSTVHVVLASLADQPASSSARSGDLPKKAKAGDRRTQDAARQNDLEEVLVTAEKREERLQDVPVPVTAISADTLVNSNQTRLQDYYSKVPGLSYATTAQGSPVLAIRGLVTGTDLLNPTVAIVVDDVPIGPSTQLGGGGFAPDIDPSELERVEVLRGPQGALYGASSLGGLLKYVTVDPSTMALTGQVLAGTSTVHNGAELGYVFRGSVNVPVTDTFALRASAFTHQDPGYVDNPTAGLRGVNESHVSGARLSGMWRPTDDLSLKLSALYQDTRIDGENHVGTDPGLGDLQQDDTRGTGALSRIYQAYYATLKAKLGVAELTSISGYSVNRLHDSFDYTVALGGLLDGLTDQAFGIPNGTTRPAVVDRTNSSKFTQEIRLSVPIGEHIEWLLGGFYTHEHNPWSQPLWAVDPIAGSMVARWADFSWVVTYKEYSAFTDVTLHFTDQFDVQLGGRESHIVQNYHEIDQGPFVTLIEALQSPLLIPPVNTTDNPFTYLVTPRYKFSPQLMVYARLASGYRPGGPNAIASPFGAPVAFSPDKTKNYEIGAKGDFFEHRLSFDTSVYYIDWKGIQIGFIDPTTGFGYNANGSRAKSEGIELSVQGRPVGGLSLGGWISINDAELTEPFPANGALLGQKGERLPSSSKVSGNVSIDDEFPLGGRLTGFVGTSVSYVGGRKGNFAVNADPPPSRENYPAYAQVDLRAGARLDGWTLNVFATNVSDKRGVVYGGAGTLLPNTVTFIQPRTIGMSLSSTF